MAESCVETEAAPEWLLKLESRREKIKGKLGHESGNGAPCIVCGAACPGLDLHFWRKVCRNCKCRKEQHDCKDDDVTGWAQFEILGAIRSKPAYIKISELTDKPIQLEWVPPNVTAELASDYMSNLGKNNIPIAGSDAATKRKQQLEYQVPPHDLDSSLCHNLTENEAQQMAQYVNKIKENCVGQGNVVRVEGGMSAGRATSAAAEPVEHDRVLSKILNSEDLKKALSSNATLTGPRSILRLSKTPLQADFMSNPHLSDKVKYKLKLMQVDSESIESAVKNGRRIDSIIAALEEKNVNFQDDCLLGPINSFRKEYLNNPKFQSEINNFLNFLNTNNSPERKGEFNSPLPVKSIARHGNLQYQETPVRKLKFQDSGQKIETDKILANILHSDIVQGVLHNAPVQGSYLKTLNVPMVPDFHTTPYISDENKRKLEKMKINSEGVLSAIQHQPAYAQLLDQLKRKRINYSEDAALKPIEEFLTELSNNVEFRAEIMNFVQQSVENVTKADPLLSGILGADAIKDAFNNPPFPNATLQLPFEQMYPDYQKSPHISQENKWKLDNIRMDTLGIQSGVLNGQVYDQLFAKLKQKGVNYAQDNILASMDEFRATFLADADFKQQMIDFVRHSDKTPFEIATSEEQDPVLTAVLHSEPLKGFLNNIPIPGAILKSNNLPMIPDFENTPFISDENKEKLQGMGIDSMGIKSAVQNGRIYDQILDKLKQNGVHFAQDTILQPINEFRAEFLSNDAFQNEMKNFAQHLDEEAIAVSYIPQSRSEDSGFGSVPPTPNYSTYPGLLSPADLKANEGLLTSIPAIADMNMYPEVQPGYKVTSNPFQSLEQDFESLAIENAIKQQTATVCSGCDKDIIVGEVAVKAERAGKEAAWHPQCFKCKTCQELLADLVYFYHGGKVYCARDLAEILKIPRCSACDELIFTKEYTAAEGATFHIKHFCCYQCDAPLAGQQYVPDEKSNMPLCLSCYDAYFAKSCHSCRGNIGPAEQGVAWGNIHWHSFCFLCAGKNCGKSLIGGRFCVKNEMPFCSPKCLKSIIF